MKAVIGAAYGDEGKGRLVHELATESSVVCRFNGGSQAGHTVCHDGQRHVFSHLGAGSFKGARTHLSRFFVCKPDTFCREVDELGFLPKVTVDPRCYVTTPLDVAFNWHSPSNLRHGTVGMGFGETIERCERSRRLTVGNLLGRIDAADFNDLMGEWASIRSEELGIDIPEFSMGSAWKESCRQFLSFIEIKEDDDAIQGDVIFEGAQGLMLDQDHANFPYVTRSKTGIHNVRELVGDDHVEEFYVSRAYTTKHGNGPLPFECACPYEGIEDLTNRGGMFQGDLRFSYLNLDAIAKEVRLDSSGDHTNVITCMDQVPDHMHAIHDGAVRKVHKKDLPALYQSIVGGKSTETRWSP